MTEILVVLLSLPYSLQSPASFFFCAAGAFIAKGGLISKCPFFTIGFCSILFIFANMAASGGQLSCPLDTGAIRNDKILE